MRITVIGVPVPQGSKSAHPFRRQDGSLGATIHEGKRGPKLKDWRQAIAAEAADWMRASGTAPMDGPIEATFCFYLPRPKSAPKRVLYPTTKPDWDKLARAVGDALKGIVYTDDSRIVDAIVRKRFAIDSPPRVFIELRAAAPEEQLPL